MDFHQAHPKGSLGSSALRDSPSAKSRNGGISTWTSNAFLKLIEETASGRHLASFKVLLAADAKSGPWSGVKSGESDGISAFLANSEGAVTHSDECAGQFPQASEVVVVNPDLSFQIAFILGAVDDIAGGCGAGFGAAFQFLFKCRRRLAKLRDFPFDPRAKALQFFTVHD